MSRLTMIAGALGVALLTSTGAFAQVPADPANPNEAIPDALTPTPYGAPISLEDARKVAAAALAETAKRKWDAFCVAVVGPTGDLVYFEKQDNCQYASINLTAQGTHGGALSPSDGGVRTVVRQGVGSSACGHARRCDSCTRRQS